MCAAGCGVLAVPLRCVNPRTGKLFVAKGADRDHDGVPDHCDNCVLVENSFQRDIDKDGIGT